MKISLDFDGVISHTMDAWCKIYTIKNPTKQISIADIKRWNFFEDFGLTVDQAFEIFDQVWEGWSTLPALERDQWYKVQKLSKVGEVDIVTSIKPKHEVSIRSWLNYHNIVVQGVIFSSDKHNLKYDVYIDDSPINAVKIKEAGKICLLYNQEWNKNIESSIDMKGGSIVRVYSLDHAIDVINRLVKCGVLKENANILKETVSVV